MTTDRASFATEARTGGRAGRPLRFSLGVAAVIIAACVAVYWQSAKVPFLFDDYPGIERNESIRHLWPLRDALHPPLTAAGATGRPIVNLSLAINYACGGLDPTGYHWLNVGFHAGVALLLFGVLRLNLRATPKWRDQADGIAASIALLWAIHPLTTESVVCVIQRNELLGSLCLLATLYTYLRSLEVGARARLWQVAAISSCLVGMASKETMVGAPLLVLLHDRTFGARTFKAAWAARRWFYAGLAATWLLLASLVASDNQRSGTVGFGLGTSTWDYLVTQAQALTLYLKLCFWPHPLVLDYGFYLAPGLASVWPAALLIVALLVATAVCLVRKPAVGFVAACFFVLLAPSSSIVPLTTQTIAEHRMYLPAAAVLTLATLGIAAMLRRRGWLVVTAALAAAGLTMARVATYRTAKSIWTDTLAKRPENARAWSSLAHVYVAENRWVDAARLYERSLTLRPDYADTQNDYANVLLHQQRLPDALAHYRAARRLKPRDNDIQFNFAGALVQAGDLNGARDNLKAVLARDPANIKALNNLGDLALKLNHADEALAAFNAAIAIDPRSAAAHNNAAVTLMQLGRYAEAVPHYATALQLMGASAMIHHNLALALDGVGRLTEAEEHEQAALRLDPNASGAREHLADLQRRTGTGP